MLEPVRAAVAVSPTLPVSAGMSRPVHVVAPDAPLTMARELMHAYACRHLPVVEKTPEGDRVVGVVTLSDLYAAEAILEADPDETSIDAIMAREAYTVESGTPLREVVTEMARRHVGSALVMEGDRLVGLFTATDACRVLADLLARGP